MRISAIDAYSTYLFHQGTNYSSYRLFGAHLTSWKQKSSVRFCVWAPHARARLCSGIERRVDLQICD